MPNMQRDYKDLKIGREFEITQVKATEVRAKTGKLKEWTRTILALSVFATCLVILGITAIYSDDAARGDAVIRAWAIVAVPMTAIFGHYFRGQKPSDEDDA